MPEWLSPYLAVPQPSASDLLWGVFLWLLGILGALVRINPTQPWWRPTSFLLAAGHSAQLMLFLYLLFGLSGDLKAAGLRYPGLFVSGLIWWGVALTGLAFLKGRFRRLFPAVAQSQDRLRDQIEADTDKVFRGSNYPAKPLVFTE